MLNVQTWVPRLIEGDDVPAVSWHKKTGDSASVRLRLLYIYIPDEQISQSASWNQLLLSMLEEFYTLWCTKFMRYS